MKSKLENVYNKLPAFLQNSAISLYGLKEEWIRHRGIYGSFEKNICNNQDLSKDEITKIQERLLRELLHQAFNNVPYYKKMQSDGLFSYSESVGIADLKHIPLLEKTPIRQNSDDFVNKSIDPQKLLTIHTTGSTGTPLNIICTPEVRQKNYAFFSRFLRSVGVDPTASRATIGGRIIMPSEQCKPPFWRYSFFQKSLLFSSYHMTEKNIPYYIVALQKFKPSYIDTYPSSIVVLAEFAQRKGISLSGITKAIVTSAETIFPHQRTLIEMVFGAPVYDQYGAAEMCIFVAQCTKGSYHIYSDYSIVEFIRDDGTRAEPGEEAEIVCTGLINPAMPLIRYRIGDRAVLSDKQCSCGCNFPVIDKLVGRTDDVIVTPDGRRVGRLSPVLKGFPIREAQYRQVKIEEVVVNIVKDEGYGPGTDQEIIAELCKRLGTVIQIKINHVEAIERGKGGKLRSVISLIGK